VTRRSFASRPSKAARLVGNTGPSAEEAPPPRPKVRKIAQPVPPAPPEVITDREIAEIDESALDFARARLDGRFEVDDFGFDPELTDKVLLNIIRPLYRSWFRVEATGLENVPSESSALVVANHSGVIAFDSVMAQVALHDEHPAHRHLRMLGANLVFQTPFVGEIARKAGHTLACHPDAERLLRAGEVVGVWPEGFKGIGKPFSQRYKLQRFGRGGSSPPRCAPVRRSFRRPSWAPRRPTR